jgi:hypothetical protein
VNSAVNAPVQWTSKTPKLTFNAAPNLKCWSLSLLQMVTLFQAQAQAQATMAATRAGPEVWVAQARPKFGCPLIKY